MPNAEFVGSVSFSQLGEFEYKRTLITGLDFRDSERLILKDFSEEVIVREFEGRGFTKVDSDADFYAVVKWRKTVSSYPPTFGGMDNHPMGIRDRDDIGTYRFTPTIHLVLEIYETEEDRLFWRKEIPEVFNALQLTEERLINALEDAIQNFPDRVEFDPSLPSLE